MYQVFLYFLLDYIPSHVRKNDTSQPKNDWNAKTISKEPIEPSTSVRTPPYLSAALLWLGDGSWDWEYLREISMSRVQSRRWYRTNSYFSQPKSSQSLAFQDPPETTACTAKHQGPADAIQWLVGCALVLLPNCHQGHNRHRRSLFYYYVVPRSQRHTYFKKIKYRLGILW